MMRISIRQDVYLISLIWPMIGSCFIFPDTALTISNTINAKGPRYNMLNIVLNTLPSLQEISVKIIVSITVTIDQPIPMSQVRNP